jgi:CheY-like chemotaxis protein
MPKILVVDDDKIQREIYEAVFADAGFEVVSALDGGAGWIKFVEHHPDVVFTGIMMPGLTGFQLIEKIRDKFPDLPVVIFSHLGRPEDREKAREKNIAFMIKGLDSPKKILEQIRRSLKDLPKATPEA